MKRAITVLTHFKLFRILNSIRRSAFFCAKHSRVKFPTRYLNFVKYAKTLFVAKLLILGCFLCLFSSCATISLGSNSKTVSGVHPANVNLNGAKSITVLSFWVDTKTDFTNQSDLESANQAAKYIRECLVADLEQSKALKYKVSNADVAISGRIIKFMVETENTEYGYIRSVVAVLEYDIVGAKNGTHFATKTASVSAASKVSGAEKRLPKAYALIEPKLPIISTMIMQDVQPYTVVNRISLIKMNKNRSMRKAYRLFAKGRYSDSMQAYLEIYENASLFEAGYNAVRIMQIKGELESAKTLSTELFNRFKDTRAANVLYEIENQQVLAGFE